MALFSERERERERGATELARRDGFDWGRIGRLLGVTRQSARERYRVIVPTPPPHVVAEDRYLRHDRETERLITRMRTRRPDPAGQDEAVPW